MLGVPTMSRDFTKLAFAYFMTEVDSTADGNSSARPRSSRRVEAARLCYRGCYKPSRGFAPAAQKTCDGGSGRPILIGSLVHQNTTSLTRALDKSDSLRDTALRAEIDPCRMRICWRRAPGHHGRDQCAFRRRFAVATGPVHLRAPRCPIPSTSRVQCD